MENKIYNIGYEQTDKELIVNIYGLDFKIRSMSVELKSELEELIKDDNEDFELLYKIIDKMLEIGASEKINDKRLKDGYAKLSLQNIIAIVNLVTKVQAQEIVKEQVQGTEETKQIFNDYNNQNGNRDYRRYNNRSNNNNGRYNNNYNNNRGNRY